MDTTTPRHADRVVTGWAVAGLVSLLPIAVLAWAVVLSGERGSVCFEYGEQCPAIPRHALGDAFFLALLAGVAALAWPRARCRSARAGAVLVQWGAQLTLAALILSGA